MVKESLTLSDSDKKSKTLNQQSIIPRIPVVELANLEPAAYLPRLHFGFTNLSGYYSNDFTIMKNRLWLTKDFSRVTLSYSPHTRAFFLCGRGDACQ